MFRLSAITAERAFLSTAPAGHGDRRMAIGVALASFVGFATTVPFARLPLPAVWAFIPSYESAIAVIDLITAVLLLGQFGRLRSRALLVLAAGYLFTALMVVPHALTFPGLLSPTGLLGAGPQTTAWLYMLWHGGFPLFVIGYAGLCKRDSRTAWPLRFTRAAALCATVAVIAGVCALTLLSTAGAMLLPEIMDGNGYTTVMKLVVSSVWILSLLAVLVLSRKRPLAVLDLWLMVVMCAWLFDIALSAVLNAGRFDLGFYAGRIYGLLAASFVLVVLLTETGNLYERLARSLQLAEERNDDLRASAERLAQSEQALRIARDEAVVAETAKSQFLATASHDLRQPLHALNLFISALRRRVSGAEAPTLVENMGSAVKSMQMMFDSLLDISKLNAGAVTPDIQDFPIENVLARLRNEFSGPAAAKSIEFIIRGSAATVRTDPTLLQSILRNLISNAVRYTKVGHVAVECRERGPFLHVQVLDTGTGIPADKIELAFNEFQRFDKSDAKERGLGLGLAIVKRLARLLGLHIEVTSEVGRGSTFAVEVPIGTSATRSERGAGAAATSLVGRRVLLVEDDPLVRDAVAREIADWGAEAITAATPDEALDLVSAQPQRLPDVAIIDRDLGKGMTGPQLLRALVARFGAIPAVIVTGATDPDALAELRAAGYRWLTKPVDSDTLKRVVSELLPARSPAWS
jgi:two-component system sensor histidine kinase/response regulator